MAHGTAQMEYWASSWAAVVITPLVTEGTEEALPLMKLSGSDTSHSCFSWLCITHIAWEANPRGVFNRGYGRIDWCSSLIIWSFQSLSLLAGCLPRCFALEEEKRPQRNPSKSNRYHDPFNTSEFEPYVLSLSACHYKKSPSVCNPDIISCWARSFKTAWHEAQ